MIRFPPKKILLAFDFSPPSIRALKQARLLSRRFGAILEIVHVLDPVPLAPFASKALRGRVYGPEFVRKTIRSRFGGEELLHWEECDPVMGILRRARTSKADLIVMGTHGRTGLSRVWIGSVAEGVSRWSPIPVLTVRSRVTPLRSVLAPVNLANYSKAGLLAAAAVANASEGELSVLCVDDGSLPKGKTVLRLERLAESLPDSLRSRVSISLEAKSGRATEEILKASKGSDAIVIVAHRKSLLGDSVLGTTAERVLRHSSIPVLSIPAPRSA